MNNRKLYRQINVWERIEEDRVAVYRCFEVLPDKKYCVQSKDFFSVPLDPEVLRQFRAQLIELLSEEPPDREPYVHDTLEEAIQNHDEDFAWAASLKRSD